MKLLGWMHRKFRQNSNETFKDFPIGHHCTRLSGQQSLDNQEYHNSRPSYSSKCLRQSQRDCTIRNSFAGLEAVTAEEEYYEEDSSSSTAISELFHGFLAIGTLGSDPVFSSQATPTFAVSLDNITEKETEVTENDLKLINEELEKVLGAEAKEDGCNDSSGRSSHVSTITLGGNEKGATTVCPLQDYLFGSSIELPETTQETIRSSIELQETTPQVTKKEHHNSLGELFQKCKIAEEYPTTKNEREEKQTEKEVDKSAVHLMKKMLKRRMLHTSRSSAADCVPAETKLPHKVTCNGSSGPAGTHLTILQMFQRKIHPEGSTGIKKSKKPNKCEIKDKNPHNVDYKNGDRRFSDEDIVIFPQKTILKECISRYKSHSNPPQFALTGSDSNGNGAYWIKTDAEYLVLEL